MYRNWRPPVEHPWRIISRPPYGCTGPNNYADETEKNCDIARKIPRHVYWCVCVCVCEAVLMMRDRKSVCRRGNAFSEKPVKWTKKETARRRKCCGLAYVCGEVFGAQMR